MLIYETKMDQLLNKQISKLRIQKKNRNYLGHNKLTELNNDDDNDKS
jgi:hypothetical protein